MNGAVSTRDPHHLRWFTSSHSGSEGGNCVEVAVDAGAVHVRDSKAPDGPRLTVSPAAWSAFVRFARESC